MPRTVWSSWPQRRRWHRRAIGRIYSRFGVIRIAHMWQTHGWARYGLEETDV